MVIMLLICIGCLKRMIRLEMKLEKIVCRLKLSFIESVVISYCSLF